MKLRIAEVHDLWYKIPVEKYGGSERVIYPLVENLVEKGHDVTLYAAGTSETSAKLVSVYPRPMYDDGIARTNFMYPLLSILEAIENEKNYDIIHFHLNVSSDYSALPLSKLLKHKTVFTLHFAAPILKGYPDRQLLLERFKELNYISISNAQRKGMESLNWIKTVYNGINLKEFSFNLKPKDYFVWMGKFNPDKGAKEAILAAKRARVTLHIAGAIDTLDGKDYEYYHKEIKPLIDNKEIIYVGEVGGKIKDELLGNALGFLNPIQWNEPFGLVMAESLATGTPVISFNNGAAPEIIENGKNGYLVNSIDEMVERIKSIRDIDRATCRNKAEISFSTDAMTNNYLQVFEEVTAKKK